MPAAGSHVEWLVGWHFHIEPQVAKIFLVLKLL
jgi:hypothetical protein